MKKIVTSLFFFITGLCYSYDTIPDLLIWGKDTIKIQFFPLNFLNGFDQNKLFGENNISSGAWHHVKNYTAEWQLIENKLYLSNIYSCNYYKDHVKADLKKLFTKKYKKGLVLADWFTGNFYVPVGKSVPLPLVHPEIKIFESEWTLTIDKGVVLNKLLNNDNYYQSDYVKNKDSLGNFVNSHFNWNNIPDLGSETIKPYVTIKTGKSKNDFTIEIQSKNEYINKEITRILHLLPEFDYYFRHGKTYTASYRLPIRLNEKMRPK